MTNTFGSAFSPRSIIFSVFLLFSISLVPGISLRAQDGSSSGEVDQEITINVVPGRMKYDTEEITVKPGSTVKLTLKNGGSLQHNLLICKKGDTSLAIKVAKKAWKMDAPIQNDYVPESDNVLFHTKLLNPGDSDSITFTVPEEPGDYPYVCTLPGHAQTMNGMMHVKEREESMDQEPKDKQSSLEPRVWSWNDLLKDLEYKYYEGGWKKLPNFDKLTPKKSGPAKYITLEKKERKMYYGFLFTGKLKIPAKGTYTFFLESDDGSRVSIDGETAVEDDGIHGARKKKGRVPLDRGTHDLRVEYFNRQGGESLKLSMKGPGFRTRAFLFPYPFYIVELKSPRVMRVRLPDASARSIAVGFPEDQHFCFDASTCYVKYGWQGNFLDVGPERGFGKKRGGKVCTILGTRFSVGTSKQPLRIGDPENIPDIQFQGYTRDEKDPPVFHYKANDILVHQTVHPLSEGRGFTISYQFENSPDQSIFYKTNRDQVSVSASRGSWEGNILSLPDDLSSFQITIHNDKKGK